MTGCFRSFLLCETVTRVRPKKKRCAVKLPFGRESLIFLSSRSESIQLQTEESLTGVDCLKIHDAKLLHVLLENWLKNWLNLEAEFSVLGQSFYVCVDADEAGSEHTTGTIGLRCSDDSECSLCQRRGAEQIHILVYSIHPAHSSERLALSIFAADDCR